MAEEVPPGVIVSALQILVTPSATAPKPWDARPGDSTYFQNVLQASLEELHQKLATDQKFRLLHSRLQEINCHATSSDPQWCFVLHCLHLLSLLQKSLTSALEEFKKKMAEEKTSARRPTQAPPLSPDTLSLQQQGTVSRVLQFLVCLGVVPCLQPGVGLPLSARSEFASKLVDAGSVSDEARVSRLLVCGQVLVNCLEVESLSGLVLSRHLSDILALLLQLCHGTKWEAVTVQEVCGLYSVTESGDSVQNKGGAVEEGVASTKAEEMHISSGNDNSKITSQKEMPETDLSPSTTRTEVEPSPPQLSSEVDPSSKDPPAGDSADSKLSSSEDPSAPPTSTASSLQHKQVCCQWLKKLLKQVPPQLLVRELLVLQGRPQKGAPPGGKACPRGGVQGTPPWLRRVCGRLLCDVLTNSSQGVLHVMAGMMQGPQGQFTGDWRSCNAVAKVIVVGARTVKDKESYYKRVCPQVLSLLRQPGKPGGQHLARVVSASLRESLALDPDLAQRHLVEPLLAPLLRCCHDNGAACQPGELVVSEAELSACLEDLHRVLVLAAEPDSASVLCLHPALPALYRVYCTARSGVSHLRSPSRELLTAYLSKEETTLALACLQFLLLRLDPQHRFQPVPSSLVFQPGPGGGVKVTVSSGEGTEEEEEEYGEGGALLTEEDCQGVVELLTTLQSCGLAGEFFLFLMKELTNIINAETGSSESEEEDHQALSQEAGDTEAGSTASVNTLLLMEQRQEAAAASFQRRLSMLSLLAAMCEALGPDCLKGTLHILEFVQATLQRGVEVCEKAEEELTGLFESETLTMAMGLLTAVMAEGKKLGEAERQKMDELLPLLERIGTNHGDPTVQEMASDLRIAIATRGVVWSSLMKDKVARAEEAQRKKTTAQKTKPPTSASASAAQKKPSKPLIEVISETVTEEPDAEEATPHNSAKRKPSTEHPVRKPCQEQDSSKSQPSAESSNQNVASGVTPSIEPQTPGMKDFVIPVSGKGGEKSALRQAYGELCDPLVPVRGHALLTLGRLLEEGDSETLADTDTLVKVFLENVAHGDSYLYLASVSGLAALAGRRHQTVVPLLAAEFADWHAAASSSSNKAPKSPDLRAKLGEVLVKATRNLGDLAPQYRDVLLTSLLCGTRDQDAMVRASSLSSLAELCRLLRFALGPVLHEVLECCSSLLKTDRDAEVRKAAALMLTQLLAGLGKDVFKVLEAVLRDLYRLLRLRVAVETEEGVRLHLALALQQLDAITREAMFPGAPALEKKIRVLSAD